MVLREISPGVPAGPRRALFAFVAVIQLHAFDDGNGRLERFIFNWEMENAGLDGMLLTQTYKKRVPASLDQATMNSNVMLLLEDLCRIYDEGSRQLEAFNQFMD